MALRWRSSIERLMLLGLVLLIGIGSLSFVPLFYLLRSVQTSFGELTIHAKVLSAAAYEMEINVVGTAQGVLNYLESGAPASRQRVDKGEFDFWTFHKRYAMLAGTARERAFGEQIADRYRAFVALGRTLMQDWDQQRVEVAKLELLEERLFGYLPGGESSAINLSFAGAALVRPTLLYINRATALGKEEKQTLDAPPERMSMEPQQLLDQVEAMGVDAAPLASRDHALNLQLLLRDAVRIVPRVMDERHRFKGNERRFTALRSELDNLLDEGLQPLAEQSLSVAAQTANDSVKVASYIVLGMLATYAMVGFFIGRRLLRAVGVPLKKLVDATDHATRGNLKFRVAPMRFNEFDVVGNRFNLMLQTLEQTTVSKQRLETAQHELQQVNATLRAEMNDHSRSQRALRHSQERLRALAAHRESVREEERRRIAREVHDSLGSALTAIKMQLGLAMSAISDNSDYQTAATRINEADTVASGATTAVRAIINDLRPSALDHLGVWPAIEQQLEDLQRLSGLSCELDIAEDVERMQLSTQEAIAIFRIVQEALTNVVKHARARNVRITARLDDNSLELGVRDDGVGFFPESSSRTGYGLLGMQERAFQLGGNLSMAAAPQSGTLVLLVIPHNAVPQAR